MSMVSTGREPKPPLPAGDRSEPAGDRPKTSRERRRVRERSEDASEDDRVAASLPRGRVEVEGRGSQGQEEAGDRHPGTRACFGPCEQGDFSS